MKLFLLRILYFIHRKLDYIIKKLELSFFKEKFPEDYQKIQSLIEEISLTMKNGPVIKIEGKNETSSN